MPAGQPVLARGRAIAGPRADLTPATATATAAPAAAAAGPGSAAAAPDRHGERRWYDG